MLNVCLTLNHHLHSSKNKIFEGKIVNVYLSISANMFWVLKRTTSLRQLFCEPTIYVQGEKENHFFITHSYLEACRFAV